MDNRLTPSFGWPYVPNSHLRIFFLYSLERDEPDTISVDCAFKKGEDDVL
jgi:hypothetical protein